MPDTEATLCDEFNAWIAANGLRAISADELLHELLGEPNTEEQCRWLEGFIERWEATVA